MLFFFFFFVGKMDLIKLYSHAHIQIMNINIKYEICEYDKYLVCTPIFNEQQIWKTLEFFHCREKRNSVLIWFDFIVLNSEILTKT